MKFLPEVWPEMTIFDRMGAFSESGKLNLSFRFHGTVYQFPVQGTLVKNCQSATQLLGEKKTTELLKANHFFIYSFRGKKFQISSKSHFRWENLQMLKYNKNLFK